MKEQKIVRAIDPDAVLTWEHEGVTYKYTQPAGVFAADNQKEHGDMMLDSCVVSAKGLEGGVELRKRGHAWSRIIPQPHANRLYLQILGVGTITEAEVEG